MRVTNNMLVNNMVYNLNQNLKVLEKLQYQKASGKKFRVPSDNPIGVSKSLKFNTDLSKLEQYNKNVEDALSWMTDTDAALREMVEALKRAYDLTEDAANGTKTTEDLHKIKEEIDQIKEHIIQIGNTTYAGRHIFSGYKTDKKLFEDGNDGKYSIGLGTDEIFEYNVGVSERVKINTLGSRVFGVAEYDSEGELVGANYTNGAETDKKAYLIAVFDELSAALEKNDPDEIQKSITRLQDSMEQVLAVNAEVGAKMNRLELTQKKLGVQMESVKELLSLNEDVDLAEITIEIGEAQNIYMSSLMVGAKVIQPSLVEFLR
ncbi:MAG: flagellar hook-associated protein FlgL [Tissierellia bacterium]|nr:flagellar hook-associated protein FlgL [Tissierellia bacterium]